MRLYTVLQWLTPALAAPGVNVYWGQSGVGDRLVDYCASGGFDYVSVAFVNVSPENAGTSGYPGTNFAAHCSAATYSNNGTASLLQSECEQIREDIPKCQDLGIKVILSIGGVLTETSNYTISSVENGRYFGEFLWGAFGPYNESWTGPRPFDISETTHVAVDGFDFDLEAYWSDDLQGAWVAMISRMRELGCNLITAAPQCPTDKQWFQMYDIIRQAAFDIINIQFYNNEGNIPNLFLGKS